MDVECGDQIGKGVAGNLVTGGNQAFCTAVQPDLRQAQRFSTAIGDKKAAGPEDAGRATGGKRMQVCVDDRVL
ncbi:hypothetical protein D9M72_631870 [compost metagenome]